MSAKALSTVAALVSIAIIGGWSIYWGLQIQDVMELLEMAKEP